MESTQPQLSISGTISTSQPQPQSDLLGFVNKVFSAVLSHFSTTTIPDFHNTTPLTSSNTDERTKKILECLRTLEALLFPSHRINDWTTLPQYVTNSRAGTGQQLNQTASQQRISTPPANTMSEGDCIGESHIDMPTGESDTLRAHEFAYMGGWMNSNPFVLNSEDVDSTIA